MTSERETCYSADGLKISRVVTGPLSNNVYFVTDDGSSASVMIDAPGGDPDLLVALCDDLSIDDVLITHGHHDHIGAAPRLEHSGRRIHIGGPDRSSLGETSPLTIRNGDQMVLGSFQIRALATPGHTPGSMCLAVVGHPVLLTGDTLFPGGPGATKAPGSDFPTIMESIDQLFAESGDETLVLPGHGSSTTIGYERPFIEDWRARGW